MKKYLENILQNMITEMKRTYNSMSEYAVYSIEGAENFLNGVRNFNGDMREIWEIISELMFLACDLDVCNGESRMEIHKLEEVDPWDLWSCIEEYCAIYGDI